MKKSAGVWLTVGLVLAVTAPLGAADDDKARAVIEKGIKAAGGETALAKYNAATWTEKGKYYGMGEGLPYTGKYAVQWPDKFRMEIEGVFLIVVNGEKGWTGMGGESREMTKEQLDEQREQLHESWVATLLPLKDKTFTLTLAGEQEVAKRPAVGVNVSSKGHRDVKLLFDKETGLLVKSESTVKAEELGGREVTQEVLFQDYKDVGGIKTPAKFVMKRDGKLFIEAEMLDLKPAEKLDESTFGKP